MLFQVFYSVLLLFSSIGYTAIQHELHSHLQAEHSFQALDALSGDIKGSYHYIAQEKYAAWFAFEGAKPYNTTWNNRRQSIFLVALPSLEVGVRAHAFKSWIIGTYIHHDYLTLFSMKDNNTLQSEKNSLHRTAVGFESIYLPFKTIFHLQFHMDHRLQAETENQHILLSYYLLNEPFGVTIDANYEDLKRILPRFSNIVPFVGGYYIHNERFKRRIKVIDTHNKLKSTFGISVGASYQYATYFFKARILFDNRQGFQLGLSLRSENTPWKSSQRTSKTMVSRYLRRSIDTRIAPISTYTYKERDYNSKGQPKTNGAAQDVFYETIKQCAPSINEKQLSRAFREEVNNTPAEDYLNTRFRSANKMMNTADLTKIYKFLKNNLEENFSGNNYDRDKRNDVLQSAYSLLCDRYEKYTHNQQSSSQDSLITNKQSVSFQEKKDKKTSIRKKSSSSVSKVFSEDDTQNMIKKFTEIYAKARNKKDSAQVSNLKKYLESNFQDYYIQENDPEKFSRAVKMAIEDAVKDIRTDSNAHKDKERLIKELKNLVEPYLSKKATHSNNKTQEKKSNSLAVQKKGWLW